MEGENWGKQWDRELNGSEVYLAIKYRMDKK